MKMSRVVYLIVLSLCGQFAASAQSASQPSATHRVSRAPSAAAFAPLEIWKAAVIAGNQVGLASLYSIAPPSQTQTPRGTTADPREEPQFWSALTASGLSDFQAKVLAIEHRQEGAIELVLRVGGKIQTNSGMQPFIVEMHQRWLQQGNEWRIYATRRDDLAASPTMRLPEPTKPNTALYAPPEDASAEIRTALASAAKDRKRVILVFGANWCYDCHVLDATFHSKEMASLVNANYHVVHINVGDDGDKNLDLAESYGVPLKQAVRIPSLAVLSPDGKVVYSQKNGEFDDSVKLAPTDVTAFLNKWKPQG
jgi:thioredoxin 1